MIIKDFCIKNNIKWFPVKIEIFDRGNGRMGKKRIKIEHPAYKEEKIGIDWNKTDFEGVTRRQAEKRQLILEDENYKEIKYMSMDASEIMHIDIDVKKYDEKFNIISEKTPYFTSTTKPYGRHILIKCDDDFIPSLLTKQIYTTQDSGDLILVNLVGELLYQSSLAPIYGTMNNSDKEIIKLSKKELMEMLEKKPKLFI
jgi:hypothetical protein